MRLLHVLTDYFRKQKVLNAALNYILCALYR